jgi:hypothetical protein
MDTVPLDLQRRCEQRWVARYGLPQEPPATPEHQVQKHAGGFEIAPTAGCDSKAPNRNPPAVI